MFNSLIQITINEIIELSKQGNLSKIDLRIADLTDKNIKTLPPELTLANFGKLNKNATRADIVLGILNMVFEVIGMMTAFASINDDIKDVVKDVVSDVKNGGGLNE